MAKIGGIHYSGGGSTEKMADQTQASLARKTIRAHKLVISKEDRGILRGLGGRVAELAADPVQQEKRDLWYRHNALEDTRPLIFCDPENGWNEIISDEELECRGELPREWEMMLRKEIFWGESMGDEYIYSMKPHPSDLAVPSLDENKVRARLRKALQITRKCRVEIIMKDNHTIGGNPENVIRWCQIARQEAEEI